MREVLASVRQSRSAFLVKYGKDLNNEPFRRRFRERYLVWILMFSRITLQGIPDDVRRIYCKTADRIFGGNRYERFRQYMLERIARLQNEQEVRRKQSEERIAAANRKIEEAERALNSHQASARERYLQMEHIIDDMLTPDADKTIH